MPRRLFIMLKLIKHAKGSGPVVLAEQRIADYAVAFISSCFGAHFRWDGMEFLRLMKWNQPCWELRVEKGKYLNGTDMAGWREKTPLRPRTKLLPTQRESCRLDHVGGRNRAELHQVHCSLRRWDWRENEDLYKKSGFQFQGTEIKRYTTNWWIQLRAEATKIITWISFEVNHKGCAAKMRNVRTLQGQEQKKFD